MSRAVLKNCFFGFGLFLLPAPAFLLTGAALGIGALMLLPLAAALLFGAAIRCMKSRFRLPCAGLSMALCFALARFLSRGTENTVWAWVGTALSAIAAMLYPRYLGLIAGGGHFREIWYSGLAADAVMLFLSKAIPVDLLCLSRLCAHT